MKAMWLDPNEHGSELWEGIQTGPGGGLCVHSKDLGFTLRWEAIGSFCL